MARTPGNKSKVYVDEFNFSGRVSAVEIPFDVNLPEVTAFADTAGEFVEGQYKGSVMQNGFFDPTDDAIDEEMWADLVSGADHLVGVYPGNSAAQAAVGYELQARPNSEARPIQVAGAVLLNVTWQGNGPVVRSKVLCNEAVTETGAISGSSQNIGATDAGEKFVAILRVLSVTGSGSITVEVEESSDDGDTDAFAQLIAFTAATGLTSERKTTIGATEAYKRINVTAFSGFSSVTIMVVVGQEQGVS